MKKKKILAMGASFALIAALAIGGTMAYLTTEPTTKSNVFSVGDVSINLTEDTAVFGEGGEVKSDSTGADYTEIMPGDYLKKEVTVENTGSKDAYVQVTVTMNNANKINAAIDDVYENEPYNYSGEQVQAVYTNIFDGWGINYNPRPGATDANNARGVIDGTYGLPDHVLKVDFSKTTDFDKDTTMFSTDNWFQSETEKTATAKGGYSAWLPGGGYYTSKLVDDITTTEDERDYVIVYTYYLLLPAGESSTLFNGLNVPAEFNADQLAMFDGLKIDVEAKAIQADNIPAGLVGTETRAIAAFSILNGNEDYAAYLPNWADKADTSWYEEDETVFVVSAAEELAGLAQLVAEGNTFKNVTIKLDGDIDLLGYEWTPIGNSTTKFQGTFAGENHTISNLYISGNNSNAGFFGYTTNGEIKDLTIENASVSGRLNVGTVAGTPYTSKYTNITVNGDVKVDGFAYVGGVLGKDVYADITNVTVNVNEGSYVKANSVEGNIAYRTYVGGVIGFMGEGGHSVKNVTSNIDVFGSTCDIGGISGIAHYGNSFINCSSSGDVTVTDATEAGDAEEIGGIAGVWYNGGNPVTFEGCSYTGTLSSNFTDGVDLSDNTITGKAYSENGSGELIIK